jgi:hypothetical protein
MLEGPVEVRKRGLGKARATLGNPKPEIRRPERRPKSEVRDPKPEMRQSLVGF